ncbi:putative DRAP deaminase [Thermoascus aurantiacus ATCC 26904]
MASRPAADPAPASSSSSESTSSQPTHLDYLKRCLALAEKSPPRPTNFRVGAILVLRRDDGSDNTAGDTILSTGYTLELAGNTHAEQCCLANYAAVHSVPEERVGEVLPSKPGHKLVMYVTMEPCGKRLSGNLPCVQRIIRTREGGWKGIEKVYFGVKEPATFVGESEGCKMLTEAGVEWEHVGGLETEILAVATAGHEKREEEIKAAAEQAGTNVDDISEEERRRQEQMARNPKKRMMEVDVL